MSQFDLPNNFNQLVQETYDEAFKSGEIIFTETTQEYIEEDDTQFVLSLAPGLAKKPTTEDDPENQQIQVPKDFNPFLNPDPKTTVLKDYGNEFNILLNKFPITPNHLLLTTSKFKSQNSPLSPNELIASLKILENLENNSTKNEKFFAFFNCGENSGASQPHKHLQILKFPDNFTPFPSLIAAGNDPFIATSKKEPLQSKTLPFAHFILPLTKDKDQIYEEDYIGLTFSSLLQRALTVLRDSGSPIAYNVVFTRKWIIIVPRSQGIYKQVLGINSTAYTGLILAKSQELKDLIKNDGILNILKEIGFPNTADQPTDEYNY